jgi:hypothetical protein
MITLKEGRLFIVRWPGDWLTALLPALQKRLCALIVAANSFFFSSSLLVCHCDIAFLRLCSLCRSELFEGVVSQRIGIWTQRSFFLSSRVLRIEVYFIRYGELFFNLVWFFCICVFAFRDWSFQFTTRSARFSVSSFWYICRSLHFV